jgi:thioredoxin-dependent peroxiredoxin
MPVGEKAPEFTLYNQDGKQVRLSDYRGQKVVLFAFAKAGTAGCTKVACNYRDEFPQIAASNAVVLGISPDSQRELKRWKMSKKLPYDLLSDPDHKVLEQLGAWGFNVFGLKVPMTTHSLFVIDENGTIIAEQIKISPDDNIAKALAALNIGIDMAYSG